MTEWKATPVPAAVRSAIAADLSPVRPLPGPFVRAAALVPVALFILLAAPLVFSFRDLESLGWLWSWGASGVQLGLGVIIAGAALREAVPGRSWTTPALLMLMLAPLGLLVAITYASWASSPVGLPRLWWEVSAICLVGSLATALPAVALTSVLALRAFPTRPAITGAVAGLGGGLIADAGWRLFCHYSEPAHVLLGHLGGVALASAAGAIFMHLMVRQRPGYTSR